MSSVLIIVVVVHHLLVYDVNCVYIPCLAKIDNGYGVGVVSETVSAVRYCSYLGIPYAQPPIGKLRFEPPQRFLWQGSQYFNTVSDMCKQVNDISNPTEVVGSEDCLHLNVYTSQIDLNNTQNFDETKLLPVLFWVHGGSFVQGSSETDIFGPDFVLQNGIVVVTINYRLDALGFLSIPDFNISGNFGLKDQVAALKWVQRNIKYFGGDPSKVTLMGWSAGAAAVTYQMYSKMSKGLFHQVIAMSGVMTEPWGYYHYPEKCVEKYLKLLRVSSREELLALNANDLIFSHEARKTVEFNYFSMGHLCFIPVSEKRNKKSRAFIRKSPFDIIKKNPINDVPLMIGHTSLEMEVMYRVIRYTMRDDNFMNRNASINKAMSAYIKKFIADKNYEKSIEDDFYRKLASQADILYGIKYFRDEFMKHSKSPIYAYSFEFDGRFGYEKQKYQDIIEIQKYGAFHGDDLGYIFKPFNYNLTIGHELEFTKELSTLERTVELWTNFIKYGNPTPKKSKIIQIKWHRYNHDNISLAGQYLNIDNQVKMVREDDNSNVHHQMWDKVFKCLYYFKCDFLKNVMKNYDYYS